MANVRITIRGTTPLLCHNVQLADPDNPISKEIAKITAKRKKTEEDRTEIAKLEWYGGLYLAPGIDGPVMPTANIRKAFIEGAKITKQGRSVERALTFLQKDVPITYEGPRDIDKLFKIPTFHNRSAVRVQMARTMRTRPQFPEWVLIADAYYAENVMDLDEFRRVIDLAGMAEGLCDNRKNGYGRFTAEVTIV